MARKKIDKTESPIEKVFISFSQAQEFLGVSHQTIYNLMKKGLPSYKIGKKRVFTREDLVNWVKSQT
ncbi:helix-turn-helix domain-containing protein [Dehalogenimonas alkenigignens]|uniref:helix-turn-helix domain-containing protein n=1 Tax=Dehalogenimonas alkenigignens TaxID=1217799 RepID=UPI00140218C0|nr:helix-turn-helix domain-containing protein [Dehalogenimonas alkenigignens]